jgi:ketopantoate reductase
MKTMSEIKEMIAQYQKTLEECNAVFKAEGRSEKEEMLSKKVDKEFTAVYDAVAEHIQKLLLQDLFDIDV